MMAKKGATVTLEKKGMPAGLKKAIDKLPKSKKGKGKG